MIEPYYQADRITLYLGDCIEVMRELPEASVDAIVTDPPYGLEFMGKDWDSFAPERKNASVWNGRRESNAGWEDHAAGRAGRGGGGPQYASKQRPAKRCQKCGRRSFSGTPCVCPDPEWVLEYQQAAPSAMLAFQAWCEAWAREAYRVLKPGGHIVAFGGTRTHHRLVCGIEDAGFEIRDELDWMFGSGFPKSLDVSKAIDKAAGAEREVIGTRPSPRRDGTVDLAQWRYRDGDIETTAPATDAAREWQGWGTALKPAHEPICLARKPLSGTVAQNVLAHGTGALNIDGCRIDTNGETWGGNEVNAHEDYSGKVYGAFGRQYAKPSHERGRWPANVILDGEAAALLDATVGERPGMSSGGIGRTDASMFGIGGVTDPATVYADRGGPSRFFYTAQPDDHNELLCGACVTIIEVCFATIAGQSSRRDARLVGSVHVVVRVPELPENEGNLDVSSTSVLDVEISSASSQATSESIVLLSVPPTLGELNGHDAKSVANLCGQCATPIARGDVEALTSRVSMIARRASAIYTSALSLLTNPLSLALSAELTESTATIQITASPRPSSGSATPATAVYTADHAAPEHSTSSNLRFAYSSKASRSEREAGLDDLPPALRTDGREPGGPGGENPRLRVNERRNDHPTVKPVSLMRWLCRLITPPGGVVLDPFLGSGTTGMAALDEGFRFIGIDMTERYVEIARYRVTHRHVIDHEVRPATEALPQGRLL